MIQPITWDILGEYYGYPKCCRDQFETLSHVGGPPRKMTGTGYIPCLECNNKSEDELIKAIARNRKARLPFPRQESHKIVIKHLEELIALENMDES